MEILALLLIIALLVSARLIYEAVQRMFKRPNIAEQLHGLSTVTLTYHGKTIEAHGCVLKSIDAPCRSENLLCTRYVFEVHQLEPWR